MKLILLLSTMLLCTTSTLSAKECKSAVKCRSNAKTEILDKRFKTTKISSRQVTENSAIIETPAGKLIENMDMSQFALYPRGFDIYQRMVSGKVSAIVEGTDGCIYVKNPIGVFVTNSWLKLEHREGTTYVAKLPQAATEPWEYEGENVCLNFDRLDYDEDEEYFYPSFEESELTFNYENGILTSTGVIGEDEDMPVMLGLTYDIYGPEDPDEAWAWFGVNNITVKPMAETTLQLPASLEATKKVMTSEDNESVVWLAVNGTDIYLRPGTNFGYAKGTITDGKAVFENYQYLGISGNSHCYFLGGESKFIEDDDYYDGGYTTYYPADNLTFDYLTDDALLKSNGALFINEGSLSVYPKTIYDKPVITNYQSVEAAPKNPVITRYEYDDFDEYGVFVFELPNETADGTQISKVDLFYNIFVDGSDTPYTFTPSVYELIDEPITTIPYNFTDGDYDFSVNDTKHTIVFYDEYETVGVQSINIVDNKTFKSAIVWSNGDISGIEDVSADNTSDVNLYDLMGRRVYNAIPGIYIRRQGSQTSKIVIK